MDKRAANRWQDEVLGVLFEALAASSEVRRLLLFKGARVLGRRLPSLARRSVDIDSNLAEDALSDLEDPKAIASALRTALERAARRHFARMTPVRFRLLRVDVTEESRRRHPFGWDAYRAVFRVEDGSQVGVLGLPRLQLDIAAPEALTSASTSPLRVGRARTRAYSLPRLTGEKLRAFLTSLPEYRSKMGSREREFRVKDLYDLAAILRERPLRRRAFWRSVGREFKVACQSRFVDCSGAETFEQELARTRALYEADATIPKDVTFPAALDAVRRVVSRLERDGVVPFAYPKQPPKGATSR